MKSILTTEIFDEWLSSLKDKAGAMRIQARISVYFAQRGLEVVILLAGGDKST